MSTECTGTIDLNSAYAKYKVLFECVLDVVFLVDSNGKILDANHAAIKTYGYTREELLSKNISDIRIPSERKSIEENLKNAFTVGIIFETVHMRKNGSTFPVEISLRGVSINSEKLLLAIVRDITIRKESERSLSRLAAIVEYSRDAILGMTIEGIITEWNHGAELMYGYTSKEAIGQHISILVPADHRGEMGKILTKVSNGESITGLVTRRVRKNGEVFTALLTASPIISPEGDVTGISWVARDITERVKAEEKLRQQAALIDLSPDAVIVRTFNGTITFWSRGAESMYGYSKEEAMGQITHALLKTKFPEPPETINRQLQYSGYWSGELVHTAKDGREIVVHSRWLGQYDGLGNITNVLESNVNITDRKITEEKLNIEKERAELYLDLIAHDINNMNQIAMNYLEIVLDQAKSPEDKEYIEKSMESLQNSSKLIHNVRTLK